MDGLAFLSSLVASLAWPVAVVILVLYPNKPALWMQGGSSGARA